LIFTRGKAEITRRPLVKANVSRKIKKMAEILYLQLLISMLISNKTLFLAITQRKSIPGVKIKSKTKKTK